MATASLTAGGSGPTMMMISSPNGLGGPSSTVASTPAGSILNEKMGGIGGGGSTTSSSGSSTNSGTFQLQDWIMALINKRITTWRYLQRVYQGGIAIYNTALLTEMELQQIWSDEKTHRRAVNYFCLGTSLATILEIPSAVDCIKALNSVLQEYESFASSDSKSKSIFSKGSSSRKGSFDGTRIMDDSGEYSFLEVKSVPFTLDYCITFATLCEMCAQFYERLSTAQPQPKLGLSHWSVSSLEVFQKVDSRFKKILISTFKDMEVMARDLVVEELNLIDPLHMVVASTNLMPTTTVMPSALNSASTVTAMNHHPQAAPATIAAKTKNGTSSTGGPKRRTSGTANTSTTSAAAALLMYGEL